MSSGTISLNDFIHALTAQDIPDDVMHHARRNLLDTIGVWAAGRNTRAARIAHDHSAKHMLASEIDAVSMPFDGRKVSISGASFAGATAIDSIDGHDGHESAKGHAGAALVPTLVALANNRADFQFYDFLATLVVGYEVAIRAGLSLHASACDYHSSGAWNSIGCAAMGARVNGFDEQKTRHALGIAEYFGPRAQMMRCIDNPTMVKDSSGWGAMVGANAIYLAADGFTGAPAMLCESLETSALWQNLGSKWHIAETNLKVYPVCRWSQPAIEACLTTMQENRIAPDQIDEILVTTFHEATRLSEVYPRSCDEVQYCLPVSVALAILKGDINPRDLDETRLDDEAVLSMAGRVKFAEKDHYNDVFPGTRFADVALTLRNGNVHQSVPTVARGNFDAPLSDQEVIQKFRRYCQGTLTEEQIKHIAGILLNPELSTDLAGLVFDISNTEHPMRNVAM